MADRFSQSIIATEESSARQTCREQQGEKRVSRLQMHYLIERTDRFTHAKIVSIAAAAGLAFVTIASDFESMSRAGYRTGQSGMVATMAGGEGRSAKQDRLKPARLNGANTLVLRTDSNTNTTYALHAAPLLDRAAAPATGQLGVGGQQPASAPPRELVGCEAPFSLIGVAQKSDFYIRCLALGPAAPGVFQPAPAEAKGIASRSG
jgi:hypothetical protein